MSDSTAIGRAEDGVMPNHDPRAVANQFIKLSGGPLNQMKLQKLVYIAHGWNLAINNEPLVRGRIEAWDGGPVMRPIWDHLRDYGFNAPGGLMSPGKGEVFDANFSESEKDIIKHTWRKYNQYSGVQLSEMTHQPGTPWTNAYFGQARNAPLSNDDIRTHFTEMAIAGRQAAH